MRLSRRLLAGFCVCLLMLTQLNVLVVGASSYTSNTVVEQDSAVINVTVPTAISVYLKSDGTVILSDSFNVYNYSVAPVEIVSMTANATGDWDITDDVTGALVGTKEFVITVEDKNMVEDTAVDIGIVVETDDFAELDYDVSLPLQRSLNADEICTLTTLVDWADGISDSGSVTQEAGYYASDGTFYDYDTLVNTYGFDVEQDYTTYEGNAGSVLDALESNQTTARSFLNLFVAHASEYDGGTLVLPDGVTRIGNSALTSSVYLKHIIIPGTVESIGLYSFEACPNLESVIIAEGLITIEDMAYSCCDKLSIVSLPDSLRIIGDSSFSGCTDISNLNVPDSVESVGEDAFFKVKHVTYFGTLDTSKWHAEQQCQFQNGKCVYCGATEETECTHSYTGSVTVAATCTDSGEKTFTCSSCGDSYTESIPALGHDFSVKEASSTYLATEQTCTGYPTYYYKCSNCEEKGTDTWEDGEAVLSHTYNTEYTIDVAATCLTAGSKSRHCTGCNAKTDVVEIPATGHSYGDWVTTKAATCTAVGSKQRICSACNNVETAEIAKLSHSYTSETQEAAYLKSAATCTTAATYYYKCTGCSAKGTSTYTVGTALGHDWITKSISSEHGCVTGTLTLCTRGDSYDEGTPSVNHAEDTSEGFTKCIDCGHESADYWLEEETYNQAVWAILEEYGY